MTPDELEFVTTEDLLVALSKRSEKGLFVYMVGAPDAIEKLGNKPHLIPTQCKKFLRNCANEREERDTVIRILRAAYAAETTTYKNLYGEWPEVPDHQKPPRDDSREEKNDYEDED